MELLVFHAQIFVINAHIWQINKKQHAPQMVATMDIFLKQQLIIQIYVLLVQFSMYQDAQTKMVLLLLNVVIS